MFQEKGIGEERKMALIGVALSYPVYKSSASNYFITGYYIYTIILTNLNLQSTHESDQNFLILWSRISMNILDLGHPI